MTSRLILIASAATAATRTASFGQDEPLEDRAVALCAALAPWPHAGAEVRVSPAKAARQTAEGLALLPAAVDDDLADVDYGSWAGRAIADVAATDPDALAQWLADPDFTGHGGESRTALGERAQAWLQRSSNHGGRCICVTHGAFIRAVVIQTLSAAPQAFWQLDTAPLTVTELRHDGRRWVVRSVGCAM